MDVGFWWEPPSNVPVGFCASAGGAGNFGGEIAAPLERENSARGSSFASRSNMRTPIQKHLTKKDAPQQNPYTLFDSGASGRSPAGWIIKYH